MQEFRRAILTHGGAGSDPQDVDGPAAGARSGMDLLTKGESALNAVVHAVRLLEDDPRFNAGTGSQFRADGHTMQLDASCMCSTGGFGAVACVEGVQNPIVIAQGVLLHSEHILLAGAGARSFAEQQHIPLIQLKSSAEKMNKVKESPGCDTVGAVDFFADP